MPSSLDENAPPFLQRGGAVAPTTQRLWGTRLGLVGAALGGAVLVYAVITLQGRNVARQTLQPPAPPPTYEVSGPVVASADLMLKNSYEGLDRSPPKPVVVQSPPPIPLPEPIAPTVTTQAVGNPFDTPVGPAPAAAPAQSPPAQPPPAGAAPASLPDRPATQPPATPPTTPPQKPTPKKWLNGDTQVPIGKPPFPLEKPTQGEKDKAHDKPTSPLVQAASWAQLAHPVYALYRTQTIHGMLTHNVDSDIPGQIHILVTRPVFDELGQGVTIIPQLSKLLAVQAGKTTYGTRRLDVSIEEIQFPDKTLVRLAKAKLADQSGAVGGAGTVDNHLGRVILGAGSSALLSVGARSAGGSSNSFQPSVEQEVSRDIAGSINQSGQQIVRQQLSIGPTITLAAGDPVTIQLQENISFQKPPVIVTQ